MRAPWSRVAQGKPKFPRRDRPATWERRNTAFGLQTFLAESQHAGQHTGDMFDRARFKIVEGYPHDATRLRFRDMAGRRVKPGKAPSDPDYAVGVVMAVCQGQFWIVDAQRQRGTPLEVEQLVKWTAAVHAQRVPIHIEQEGGSAGEFVIDAFQRSVLCGFPV